ncbi:MAG: ankyrin repeat domain-containing protein [Verrucomicrobiales bacterium]|nr:ankyrin repeat domain-containing protein [Verrucomicrobiales bacterium]
MNRFATPSASHRPVANRLAWALALLLGGVTGKPLAAAGAAPASGVNDQAFPPLVAAIRAGDRDRIERAIPDAERRRALDRAGNSALHWAALADDAALVGRLIEAGLDPNATNAAGATALHYATGNPESVRRLLNAGARPNAVTAAGSMPLHTAAPRPGAYRTVRLLLDAGAEVDAARTNYLGYSPLVLAILTGDDAVARLLLERGANPNPPAERFPPVVAAAFTGRSVILEDLLRRGGRIDCDDAFVGHGLNALFYAGRSALVPYAIERGADLHRKSSYGERVPPMVWSAYNDSGDASAARWLLARGLNPNESTDSGHTALDWALKRGETPLVDFLRSQGATSGIPVRAKPVPNNAVPSEPTARRLAIRGAVERAIATLQKSSTRFLENGFVRKEGCVSCHQQTLPAIAIGMALQHGLAVDEAALGNQLHAQIRSWRPGIAHAYEMREPQPDPSYNLSYGLLGLKYLGHEPDDLTEAFVWFLARTQKADGSFPGFDRRPPLEDGPFVATATTIAALRTYPQPVPRPELESQITRAAAWLESTHPETTNDRLFRLLGLIWAGAQNPTLDPLVRDLIDTQRDDGGWAQLPGLASDAWATGIAVFALASAPSTPPATASRERGVEFLLRTQYADGSWWVRSRTWPFQPQFDGGFPHGKDQWISAAATGWAAIGLLRSLPSPSEPAKVPTAEALLARLANHAAQRVASASKPDTESPTPGEVAPTFEHDILPILRRSCGDCHSGDKPKGDFRLDSRENALGKGQSQETLIVPHHPESSPLLRYVADAIEDLEMPPLAKRGKYPPLNADERRRLARWIASGAR